jgi:redox-sensitive bicupin YhaK (pirin superfamily)
MTAGSAIAHVERTPERCGRKASRCTAADLAGLAQGSRARPGHYSHHPAASLPVSDNLGVQIRMIAGRLLPGITGAGALSYAVCRSADATATTLLIPTEHEERRGVCAGVVMRS